MRRRDLRPAEAATGSTDKSRVEAKGAPPARVLGHFFFAAYLLAFALSLRYASETDLADARTALFSAAVHLTYPFIYLLPAMLLAYGAAFAASALGARRRVALGAACCAAAPAVALTLAFLLLDEKLFRLYGFHMNGFVWNLLRTPGGVESMGGDRATMTTLAAGLGALLLLQAALLYGARRFASGRAGARRPRAYLYGIAALVLLSAGERVAYGVSVLQSHRPVQVAATAVPFYLPTTFRKFARKLGYDVERREPKLRMNVAASRLAYPLRPIDLARPARPLNLVWLVAESWRADMLDPEVMPATSAFAARAHRYENHYSGGDGTRMGLFSMFYGLYPPYWFAFLNEQRGPVLIDALRDQDYRMRMFTSAKFTYPEFDKTIFAAVPEEALDDENPLDVGWKNDRRHVGQMIDFIGARDPDRPFMTFMFFESPHARYYFPEESVIRPDYLEEFNYVTMDVNRDMARIKNRYVNACHHLDGQFGRVLAYLEESGLLDSTVVLLTGDHGEEFMEKGHWGHNSQFTEEQLRVPLVLWVPGTGAERVARMTSHLDIAPTLARLFGVRNPPSDYSLGYDLFGDARREYAIVGDWDRVGYVGAEYKATLPVRGGGLLEQRFTTREDAPLADPSVFLARGGGALAEVARDMGKFSRKGG